MKFLATFLFAAAPDAANVHAWYRADGIRASGAEVTSWENAGASGPSRSLARVAGQPRAWLVKAPGGERAVVRFDGKSALWQTAGAWGSLGEGRTVVALVRLTGGHDGTLFDGSTMSGMTRMQIRRGHWNVGVALKAQGEDQAGADTHPVKAGEWQVHSVTFKKDAGFTTRSIHRIGGEEKSPDLPDDPRVFHTVIRKQGDDGVHTYRIPGLAPTPKGTLIAVFDARNKGGGDLPGDIDVGLMRSTDHGATWKISTPAIPAKPPTSEAQMAQLDDGSLRQG